MMQDISPQIITAN